MKKEDCFGHLENVFPVGESGLREVVSRCFECKEKTACLKAALSTGEGLAMKSDLVDRAADRGLIGRLQRWSRRKTLYRLMEQKKKQT
ncbi:hypothetical protein ACFL9T_00750 [Thermodesulfobacteriota bacterium]